MTRAEIERGIKKIERRINELQDLNTAEVDFDSADVDNIAANISRAVKEIFGVDSDESKQFERYIIWHGGFNAMDSREVRQGKFAAGIPHSITRLEGLKSLLNERLEDLSEDEPEIASEVVDEQSLEELSNNRNVFVVHGHDEGATQMVARLLEKLKLDPIILMEKPNKGNTIIEKFEAYSNVGFAVVLLTPDDVGSEKKEPPDLKPRARQNVILELGYFIAKLSRKNVCVLHKGSVELPSDYHGILYVPMNDDSWEFKLAAELKAAEFDIDMNLLTQ
jgi:predicted nucleotide-binding protein